MTRIKFCGMTRVEDALFAARMGVDAIGVVVTAHSKRTVSLARAKEIVDAIAPFVTTVALCMNDDADFVRAVIETVRPTLLQFHGAESDAWCAQFDHPYLKAIAMGDGAAALTQLREFPRAQGLLLDGHGLGEPGGSGKSFDWALMPRELSQPLVLAGGLTPINVQAAIRTARPWAVDVSSGIESSPGIKDEAKMRDFFTAVRALD